MTLFDYSTQRLDSSQIRILVAYEAAKTGKQTTMFTNLIRKHHSKDFNARYIEDKYKMQFPVYEQKHLQSMLTTELTKETRVLIVSAFLGKCSTYTDSQFQTRLKAAQVENENATEQVPTTPTTQQATEPTQTEPQATEQETKTEKPKTEKPMSTTTQSNTETNGNATTAAAAGLAGLIELAVKSEIPEITKSLTADLEKRIKEEAQKLQPNNIYVNKVQTGSVEGATHKDFEEAMMFLTATRKLYLCGPTGSGKSFLAEQCAEALGLELSALSLTAGISETYITGQMLPDGSYFETDFVRAYERGGVFLMDEVDAADSNTLLILNNAIANKWMSLPKRVGNTKAKMHKDFYIICAANTWGTGDDGSGYDGREHQDKSFRDRFKMSRMFIDYDTAIEKKLLKDAPELCKLLQGIRKDILKANMPHLDMSTRNMVDAYQMHQCGFTEKAILKTFFMDWTPEERAKVSAA